VISGSIRNVCPACFSRAENRLWLMATGWGPPLKAEDGLFSRRRRRTGCVAVFDLRRWCGAGVRSSKNSLSQLVDDGPLFRPGVLRLVNQDMLDAAVQLVEHPLAPRRPFQQVARLQDQIVIVQHAGQPLGTGP